MLAMALKEHFVLSNTREIVKRFVEESVLFSLKNGDPMRDDIPQWMRFKGGEYKAMQGKDWSGGGVIGGVIGQRLITYGNLCGIRSPRSPPTIPAPPLLRSWGCATSTQPCSSTQQFLFFGGAHERPTVLVAVKHRLLGRELPVIVTDLPRKWRRFRYQSSCRLGQSYPCAVNLRHAFLVFLIPKQAWRW